MAPVIGYNYGANNENELRGVFKKSVTIMICAGAFMAISSIILAPALSNLFVGYNRELYEMTLRALRLFSVSFILSGFNIFTSSLFTALNNGLISAVISFLRTLVFQLLAVIVLPLIFELDGVWYSITVAEIFAFVISLICIIANAKKYKYIKIGDKK